MCRSLNLSRSALLSLLRSFDAVQSCDDVVHVRQYGAVPGNRNPLIVVCWKQEGPIRSPTMSKVKPMSDQAIQSIWLAEFPVRSILNIEAGKRLHFTLSSQTEVHLENSPAETKAGDKILRIVFSASDVEEAKAVSRERADEALSLASFCTQTPFKLLDQSFLMDWSPGVVERELVLFFYEPKAEEVGLLEQSVFGSAGVFSEHVTSDASRRALHWYSAGVRAELAQDQFQYFWFAVEQIAGAVTGPKLNDRCAHCRTELHCPSCDGPSEHRPYPSQKIRQLLETVGLPKDVSEGLQKFRHALMHGADNAMLTELASELGAAEGISQIVDAAGDAAWRAISFILQIDDETRKKVSIGGVDTYVPKRMVTTLHMKGPMPGDANAPKFEDIVLPKVEASIVTTEPNGKELSVPMHSSSYSDRSN